MPSDLYLRPILQTIVLKKGLVAPLQIRLQDPSGHSLPWPQTTVMSCIRYDCLDPPFTRRAGAVSTNKPFSSSPRHTNLTPAERAHATATLPFPAPAAAALPSRRPCPAVAPLPV